MTEERHAAKKLSHFDEDRLADRIVHDGFEAWRDCDWVRYAQFLAEDIEFSSPYAGDDILYGKEAVLAHLVEIRSQSLDRTLVDVLHGRHCFTALMHDGAGFMAVFAEVAKDGLIRRLRFLYATAATA